MSDTPQHIFKYKLEEDSLSFLRYIGIALVLVSVVIATKQLVGGAMMAFVFTGLTLLIRKTRVQLNLKEKEIATKKGLFGSEKLSFDKIDNFQLNYTKISQRLNSRGSTSVIHYTLFQGYAKIAGHLVLIAESRDKDKMKASLLAPAKALGVDVIDNS
ncbi:MAG: hypothetical protein OCD76_25080 [Reichenbachiella sp.]